MTMTKPAPRFRYIAPGSVRFGQYANGWPAIWIENGLKLSVNVEDLGAKPPGPNQVWIKTWSENLGVEAAITVAGLATFPGVRFHCGYDAFAVLADLTPAAILLRDEQMSRAA